MEQEFLDKESADKREKKFQRIFTISILIAILGGIVFILFMSNELESAILLLLMFVLVFQMYIFIWVFRIYYHLVPALKKDSDESMNLDDMD